MSGSDSSPLPYREPFKLSNADEYRVLAEELELAWAKLTETERAAIDDEVKKRRKANPLWPWVTSDHVDRLAEKLHRNTIAVCALETALVEPEWGLNFRVRALLSAFDNLTMLSDGIARLNGNIERLCAVLGATT